MEDDTQLIEGELYSLTQPVTMYEHDHEPNMMIAQMSSSFLSHENSINGELMGIYLGTHRITLDLGRRRRTRGKTVRRLVHVFLWGGHKVILNPAWVTLADINNYD